MSEVTKKIQKYRSTGRRLKPKVDILGDEILDKTKFTHSLTKRPVVHAHELMTHKEKTRIIESKSIEIRDEFFQTYITNIKTLTPDAIKKARKRIPWHEHMTVTSDKRIQIDQNGFNEDVQREIQFYSLTMENA